jgi:ABC-type transporter Mla subunit MlaD
MDFLVLLAQLDDTIHNAKPLPLSGEVLIDKDEVGEILGRMRGTIPEEITQAPWIVQDSKEKLAAAKRMLEDAREARASSLAEGAAEQIRGIIEAAERTAAEIRSNAERDAQRLTREAQRAAEATRRDAEQRATETTERTEAEAAAQLERVEQATGKMLERARGIAPELDRLVSNLRASIGSLVGRVGDGAGSLSTDLERMRSELSQVGPDATPRGALAPVRRLSGVTEPERRPDGAPAD